MFYIRACINTRSVKRKLIKAFSRESRFAENYIIFPALYITVSTIFPLSDYINCRSDDYIPSSVYIARTALNWKNKRNTIRCVIRVSAENEPYFEKRPSRNNQSTYIIPTITIYTHQQLYSYSRETTRRRENHSVYCAILLLLLVVA